MWWGLQESKSSKDPLDQDGLLKGKNGAVSAKASGEMEEDPDPRSPHSTQNIQTLKVLPQKRPSDLWHNIVLATVNLMGQALEHPSTLRQECQGEKEGEGPSKSRRKGETSTPKRPREGFLQQL